MMMKNDALPKEWRSVRLADACEVIVSSVDKKTVDGELPVKLCNYTDVYYNNDIGCDIAVLNDLKTCVHQPSLFYLCVIPAQAGIQSRMI